MTTTADLWVVLLAGGDGLRLSSVTRDERGRHVPKQFHPLDGHGSLLQRTLERAGSLTAPERVMAIVQESHRCWWEDQLAGLRLDNVIVQDANRGTGVAVLQVVHQLRPHERSIVLFLPSDHAVEDERAWMLALARTAAAAGRWPDDLVLVAAEPQDDPDFGWVLPGPASSDGSQTVRSFVEKPDAHEAAWLTQNGGLCSTFVFAASVRSLVRLYTRHAPALLDRSRRVSRSAGTIRSSAFPRCDFSRDLLARAPGDVRVVPAFNCGWTDLGTPARLERWTQRTLSSMSA